MFSVVIPLYNKATYIQKTINSVLAQSYKNFELIIVDDGSTDDGLQKIRIFKDERIKITEQKNAGVAVARNNGIQVADFKHIAFLDADDWWDNEFLEEMAGLINEYPDAGIYGCRYWYVKNTQKRLTKVGLPDNFEHGYIDYVNTYSENFAVPFNCSFVVVRKEVFEEMNGFNPQLKFGEDFDLWIRIALYHKVAYLNKPLAFSNQDVNTQNRALGEKIWKPANHYIFNLEYLEETEKTKIELKTLLDGLRVRALIRYHLAGIYKDETKRILNKVDFTKQPKYYQRIYKWPIIVIKPYFFVKKAGSFFKQNLKKIIN